MWWTNTLRTSFEDLGTLAENEPPTVYVGFLVFTSWTQRVCCETSCEARGRMFGSCSITE